MTTPTLLLFFTVVVAVVVVAERLHLMKLYDDHLPWARSDPVVGQGWEKLGHRLGAHL